MTAMITASTTRTAIPPLSHCRLIGRPRSAVTVLGVGRGVTSVGGRPDAEGGGRLADVGFGAEAVCVSKRKDATPATATASAASVSTKPPDPRALRCGGERRALGA